MMQGLQVLLGVSVTVTDDTVSVDLEDGRTIAVPIGWYPRLAHGTQAERADVQMEERGRDQLRRLLHTYDLRKWLFTRDVLIQSGVIPHSHPVLTLNTRYLDDDTAQLATFLHEQIHWFLTDHMERTKTDAALTELRALYPTVPTTLPAGARDEWSTYLHLIVCTLELQALTELLGEPSARQQLERWTYYTWVYRTVLTDTERIGALLRRHGIVVPER